MIPLEWMAPAMFAGLVIFMLVGYPVAFSLSALGLFFGFLAIEWGYFPQQFFGNLPLRTFSILSNDLLLAIPFFTFMGAILEKCGLAEDMLDSMGQLFGTVRGGLGYSVILVGFILGAITGTVAGQVIAMTLISLPIMIRYGYNMRYATGVLAASGTITQLVPPSLVLVVLADQLGRSVGDMYKGAWGPSILQIILFAMYTFFISRVRPNWVPGVPATARTLSGKALWMKCMRGMIPSLALIFLVLGSMGGLPVVEVTSLITNLLGISTADSPAAIVGWMREVPLLGKAIATPTEAGAMGVMGAFLLAWMQKRLEWRLVWESMQSTMRLTAMVVFILIGSTLFSLVFQGVDGGLWIEHKLSDLPGGVTGFLIFVNVFVFFLAFFLDFFEIAFIIVPLLAPIAAKMGIDLIWFGVMLCVNMQTSFMHPPFGFALFYLQGISDTLYKEKRIPFKVKSSDIYWGAIPWVVLQLVLVAIVVAWPSLVTSMLPTASTVDPSKVEIKLEGDAPTAPISETPKTSAETAADDKAAEAAIEKAGVKADGENDDIQKQFGGAIEKSADPPATTPATDPAKDAASAGQTADEKAAADIEKMLKGGK
jgi:TRAP-type mannitol/chloroaromatic compound transport system permease large subunit